MKYLLSSLFIGLSRIVIYYWPYPIKTTDIYRVNLLYVSPNRYAYISYYSDMIMFWAHIDHIHSKNYAFLYFQTILENDLDPLCILILLVHIYSVTA